MNDAPLTSSSSTEQPTTAAGRKVMFVDDDKFLLDMYTLKFSKAGYDVKAIDSTDAALKLVTAGYQPDVMLVDIVIPGMDGLQFVERIKKEKLLPTTTVIMLTNQGSSEDIARAKSLNVDGYIVKATTIPSEVLKEAEKIWANKKK
ncbi:MAG: sensor histidine kinase/response regulator [Parcubacteria bacterium C7867-002]|nr:MAG: sensor histidine kinase/response regulator [Parcubacteria bacterium C7867-002]